MTDENGHPMIPMRLARIVIRDGADQQWIYLKEVGGERGFPIIIGPNEALEIDRVVRGERTERPMTHELAANLVSELGGELRRVEITDLRNNTFFARLVIERPEADATVCVDARPSDALALGLRKGCEIRVAEPILEDARGDTSGPPDPLPPEESEPEE